ncbi:MAG TPA: RNA polymerase sigma factor [Candidatus Synoicihabitans sp.]|nr:RNA polymerase sigma factor [Candidatus Synoicihabitans sp.]
MTAHLPIDLASAPTDDALIARVRDGDDHTAFGELVRRYQSSVRHFLRHLTHGQHALADDLAQDTFIRAHHSISRYRRDAPFSTWLLGIAYNQWRNARRRLAREAALELAESAAVEQSSATASDLRADLASAMRQLSADEQLAIHLSYYQSLSHGEIATLLEWPLGTVKTHLSRGKEKLRNLLAG